MENELSNLPSLMRYMKVNFNDTLSFFKVSELEKEGFIFVQDGNHGEYRPLQDEFVEDGVPFVRPPNLIDGTINLEKCQKINESAFARIRKGIGKGGDVILTHNATIGRVAITKDSDPTFVTNPQTTVWRTLNKNLLDNKFLYYFMKSSGFQDQLSSHTGRNATFDYVSLTKQRTLVLPIVPLLMQKKIAHILGSLDDKIELNRQMNETLEAMAQALFKSWFVDFDPVIDNALAAGNAIPEVFAERAEQRKAVKKDEAINPLFPGAFEYMEEMGWIPEGWGVGSIADISFVKGGYAFKSKDFGDHGVPVIKIKNINNDKTVNTNDVQFIPNEIAQKADKFWLNTGDLIMAMTGATVGKFGLLVAENKETYLLNQRVAKFHPIKLVSEKTWFVFCFLNQDTTTDHIVNVAEGSAQPNISADLIMATPLTKPCKSLITLFNDHVDGYFSKLLTNSEQKFALENLRDTLLPKLLSGELRIPDAEKLVEEATG